MSDHLLPPTLKQIQEAYIRACIADIDTLKPGNVSRYAAGHSMVAEQFERSARVTEPLILTPGLSVGECILHCAQSTMQTVGCNTNLGILLLCVPIAHAAQSCETTDGFKDSIDQLINQVGVAETQVVFDAITTMNPGGLGDTDKHNVNMPAQAGLFSVMKVVEDKDRIAWNYTNSFDDILSVGFKTFLHSIRDIKAISREALDGAALAVYFEFLCRYPDSHIVRKHGAYMAEVVRDEALNKRESFNTLEDTQQKQAFLLEYDSSLKIRGINPGTSADLTVATLFYSQLYN